MKDDYGKKWKLNDYFMGAFCIVAIITIILIPPTLWLYSVYFVEWLGFNSEAYILPSIFSMLILWFIGMVIFEIKSNRKHKQFLNELRS